MLDLSQISLILIGNMLSWGSEIAYHNYHATKNTVINISRSDNRGYVESGLLNITESEITYRFDWYIQNTKYNGSEFVKSPVSFGENIFSNFKIHVMRKDLFYFPSTSNRFGLLTKAFGYQIIDNCNFTIDDDVLINRNCFLREGTTIPPCLFDSNFRILDKRSKLGESNIKTICWECDKHQISDKLKCNIHSPSFYWNDTNVFATYNETTTCFNKPNDNQISWIFPVLFSFSSLFLLVSFKFLVVVKNKKISLFFLVVDGFDLIFDIIIFITLLDEVRKDDSELRCQGRISLFDKDERNRCVVPEWFREIWLNSVVMSGVSFLVSFLIFIKSKSLNYFTKFILLIIEDSVQFAIVISLYIYGIRQITLIFSMAFFSIKTLYLIVMLIKEFI